MDDLAIFPAPLSTGAYVELAGPDGARRFRKQILSLGELIHPKTGEKLQLDDAWYDKLKQNWDAKVCPIVQFPAADANNQHTEDPLRNLGSVTNLTREGSKVYVDIDVPDPAVADKIGKTILGASAFLNMDYTDSRSGKRCGPTLCHVAATNRPYCTDLAPYREVIAASASAGEDAVVMTPASVPAQPVKEESPAQIKEPVTPPSDGTGDVIVLASPEAPRMTKEEMLAQLKADHGIDVEALEAQSGQRSEMSQLTAALTEALRPAAGTVALTGTDGETVSLSDVVGAVAELAEKNVALTGTVGTLQKDAAEREIDGYIGVGRLLPKSRAKAVEMVLSGDREGLDGFLAPPDQPYVKLNHVEGAAPPQGEQKHQADIDAELVRLSSAPHLAHLFGSGKK
jgi:hypothetical protein